MASGPITPWQIDGETTETVRDFIFLGSKTTANADCSHEIKTLTPWKKSYDYPRQHIKSRDITLPTKVRLVKAMVFPVVMYGCESWSIKLSAKELMLLNCGVGEDSWESLGLQGDPISKPKGNQSGIFIWRTDAEAPIFWPSDENWFTGKDLDVSQDWEQYEKETTEDEMVRWYHWLNGYESEQAPGIGDGQQSLTCCSPWDHKELDTTEWSN